MRRASTKVLFVTCYSIVILADISLATFSYLKTHSEDATFLEDLGWMPLLFVTCIVGAQSIGVYPVLQLLMGELFPSDIRSLAIGLTMSAALCTATLNILLYQFLISGLQFFGTFYLYAAVAFLALLWGVFNIPDNRGLSLANVEAKLTAMEDQKKKLDEVE
jgi:MFS family permease